MPTAELGAPAPPQRSRVWGVGFDPLTFAQTLEAAERWIGQGRPGLLVTANLNYIMLCDRHPELQAVTDKAALVVADGMPIVWASRRGPLPIPERVAGSDLIFALCGEAARLDWGVFLLGGGPGVAEEAGRRLVERFPGLRIVGVAAPPRLAAMSADEQAALAEQVRASGAKVLFAALGQPLGEKWLAAYADRLGAPLLMQVGASLDFVAGKVLRAPRWVQRCGLEFLFRCLQEPRRLGPRYWSNGVFLLRMLAFGRRPAKEPA